MSDSAIHVESLGKRYRIAAQRTAPYRTLREQLTSAVAAPARKLGSHVRKLARWSGKKTAGSGYGPTRSRDMDDFWALKDVSFEVKRGEVVGIIGHNGAGKSTLLKLLSRITEPTTGYAEICGRVGSLLEVGTGFHPELTGRENVYLNGAILGMRRAQIARQFDEIVAFAEVERFIDTPVKHYSSGMYLRLAFAVAAHLQPAILLVDEILAVGDTAFQRKCLGKMGSVAREGRTVLFVSHNMAAVQQLCARSVWLNNGTVRFDGGTAEAVGRYLRDGLDGKAERGWKLAEAPGNDRARLLFVRLRDHRGLVNSAFGNSDRFYIELQVQILQPVHRFAVGFIIYTDQGFAVLTSGDMGAAANIGLGEVREPGIYTSRCVMPADFLAAGSYSLYVAAINVGEWPPHFECHNVLQFSVEDTGGGGMGRQPGERWPGVVWPLLDWRVETEHDHLL